MFHLNSICLSLTLLAVVCLGISGLIVGNVLAQQSGHLPEDKVNTSSVLPTTTTTATAATSALASALGATSASSNNNYAASISLLTAGNNKPGHLFYNKGERRRRQHLFSIKIH